MNLIAMECELIRCFELHQFTFNILKEKSVGLWREKVLNMEGSIFTHYENLMKRTETFIRVSLNHARTGNLGFHHLTGSGVSIHIITRIFIRLLVERCSIFSFVRKMESNMYHVRMNCGCI